MHQTRPGISISITRLSTYLGLLKAEINVIITVSETGEQTKRTETQFKLKATVKKNKSRHPDTRYQR